MIPRLAQTVSFLLSYDSSKMAGDGGDEPALSDKYNPNPDNP
jgi:hypothetical protein